VKYDKFGISFQSRRLFDIAGQALVQCNARIFADKGSRDRKSWNPERTTFGYTFKGTTDAFGITPIFHGQDVPYTFFDEQSPTIKEGLAIEFQKYMLGFVIASDPNLLKPVTPMEGYYENSEKGKIVELDVEGGTTSRVTDPFSTGLCDGFWPYVWSIYNSELKPIERGSGNDELK
jgi:hypothetical protein